MALSTRTLVLMLILALAPSAACREEQGLPPPIDAGPLPDGSCIEQQREWVRTTAGGRDDADLEATLRAILQDRELLLEIPYCSENR